MSIHTPTWRRYLTAFALAVAIGISTLPAGAQEPSQDDQAEPETTQQPAVTQTEYEDRLKERLKEITTKKMSDWSADVLAERVAIAYGGRDQINRVYNTGREEGRITILTTDGELSGEFTRRFAYGPTVQQDRVRLDIIFETAPRPQDHLRYTLTYNGASVWAAQAGQYTQPDPAAAAAFKASILNDYTALFRSESDQATLQRAGLQKIQGYETEVIEMTRPDGSKTRFYISPKTFKVLHVEYDVVLAAGKPAVTFRESYSEWEINQQALLPAFVPTRRRLRQNGELVQTTDIANTTYGTSFEDTVFLQL